MRIIKRFCNSSFIQEIQLSAFEAFITVKNWVDWQEEHTLVKVAFPVNWRSPYATYEIPMGTIQRSTLGETPEAKAKWEVPAQYWADIAFSPNQENSLSPSIVENSPSIGLSILNDCKYGYDAKPDCLRLTLLRSPNWACPHGDRGSHEFTYRLVPHQGDWRKANIVQLAQELNNPLVLQTSPIANSITSTQQAFLEVSSPNIIFSAFKRSQDHSGWILRFYESHGQTTSANITINLAALNLIDVKQIWQCDLLEKKEISVSMEDPNSLPITFSPYEIKTILIME